MVAALASGHEVLTAENSSTSSLVQRFLALDGDDLHQYRALRHFVARNEKLDKSAWMDVWTEADQSSFTWQIVSEGGSGYIRSKLFLEALEAERKLREEGSDARGAITGENYTFIDCVSVDIDLACVNLKPRRKDVLLVDGAIYLHPETGDLVRIEGFLSKSPSFWTRQVNVLRRYSRIGGVRVPVAVESTASVRLAGPSTFTMTYEYESVNGKRVGSPSVVSRQSPVGSRQS